MPFRSFRFFLLPTYNGTSLKNGLCKLSLAWRKGYICFSTYVQLFLLFQPEEVPTCQHVEYTRVIKSSSQLFGGVKHSVNEEGLDVDKNAYQGETPPVQLAKPPQRGLAEVVAPHEQALHGCVALHSLRQGIQARVVYVVTV